MSTQRERVERIISNLDILRTATDSFGHGMSRTTSNFLSEQIEALEGLQSKMRSFDEIEAVFREILDIEREASEVGDDLALSQIEQVARKALRDFF